MKLSRFLPLLLITLLFNATLALAGEVSVAVAANFTRPMEQIAPAFEKAIGHKTLVACGRVGKFCAQIKIGAAFEVLICADDSTPAQQKKAAWPSHPAASPAPLTNWFCGAPHPVWWMTRARYSNAVASNTWRLPTPIRFMVQQPPKP